MTKSTFAISLQSVSHFGSGNGVAAALKRVLGRGYSFQFHNLQRACASISGVIFVPGGVVPKGAMLDGVMPSSVFLRSANDLPLIGRDWLSRYQLSGAAPRQGSGRYRNESTVLTNC